MSVSTLTVALAAVAMLMPSISPYVVEATESSYTVSVEQKSDLLALAPLYVIFSKLARV